MADPVEKLPASASASAATVQAAAADAAGAAVVADPANGSTARAPAATPSSAPAPAVAPVPARPSADATLASPELYLNRELTWLAFNGRVLAMAEDERVPVLERVKFLAITASNLDEFFMKRIGGLKQQAVTGVRQPTPDGRTPAQQIAESYAIIRDLAQRQRVLWPKLLELLKPNGIAVGTYDELSADERREVRDYYLANIYPLVTPLAMDPAHPFPFISNLSLNLLVTVRHPGDPDTLMARVKVPVGAGIPRFIRVGMSNRFVLLEDVIAHNLDLLFPQMELVTREVFRVTRNANTERDEEAADDLLELIESELRDRRFAPMVRLEVAKGMDPVHRGMLAAELGLNEQEDVFESDGMIAMRDLMELAAIDDPALHDPPHHPADHPKLRTPRSIFHIIRDSGALLLMHPYESFSTSVVRFLREASEDPKVRAIKMTLYRTSSDAEIIGLLCNAARNGKQVAVVVELKARFDEAANIQFATRLEEFGIHVNYGVIGLKTHCKVIQVVRQDYNGLRRYVHIGTGNYHPGTARIYADLGLLTCDDAIGQDATELFNFLTTGYVPERPYKKLIPAPSLMKKALLQKIDREIKAHSPASPGLIQFKVNALEDVDITRALYRASRAGVKIDLIVRDTCRLRAGVPGLSETVRVVSIAGRFLEHARIYYFRNGGAEEYFIGSADCMTRNLESRVEVLAPVEDPARRKKLRTILDCQLAPNRCAWEMKPDGSYLRSAATGDCQQYMIDFVAERTRDATRRARARLKGIARRAIRKSSR
jgi:polyphosphate kinase